MRGYSYFMVCQQSWASNNSAGPSGGWSIPFSPSWLKWLEKELKQRRGDGWTWGNCPNQVEWFPNGGKRDTGEQAGGWTDRFIVMTTGAPFHCSGHLFRVVSGDQFSPIEYVTGKWVGCPRQLSTPGVWMEWQEVKAPESAKRNKEGTAVNERWWRRKPILPQHHDSPNSSKWEWA